MLSIEAFVNLVTFQLSALCNRTLNAKRFSRYEETFTVIQIGGAKTFKIAGFLSLNTKVRIYNWNATF